VIAGATRKPSFHSISTSSDPESPSESTAGVFLLVRSHVRFVRIDVQHYSITDGARGDVDLSNDDVGRRQTAVARDITLNVSCPPPEPVVPLRVVGRTVLCVVRCCEHFVGEG
jgi:hypothetical protein